ncbi:hypothetical protein [Nocardioides sp. AX2bis]|uniref:hypothetical protein n=1 Tax=Nocardioides sp. AX2bis TaxID=2653157 RepID=UPI0012F37889|nr:hypothetical protein [Nocardioides sp. AX2bis]VXB93026.1 conserved hypothetical protein [Nocardioides sp. AX2bis]
MSTTVTLPVPIEDLDATGVLHRTETALQTRRAAEVEDLLLALHWADLHAADPRRGPDSARVWGGEDRLVDLGGDGTPRVQELCLPELATARRVHTLSARAVVADALDLRHRLPATWAVVQAGHCEVWVARRVAAMSRRLDQTQVGIVDAAVADSIAGDSPSRVLELAEAKVIEADLAAHAARLEAEARRRLVAVSRTDKFGSRNLFARMEPGDVVWVDAMVDRIADILATRPDLVADAVAGSDRTLDKQALRALALGWLAHPAAVLDLLDNPTAPGGPVEDQEQRPEPRRRTAQAVVYVHLHQAACEGTDAVARVEDLGPTLLAQVVALLRHAHVSLRPVIDLHAEGSTSSYEFPESIRERARLRSLVEAFPHATRSSRRTDMDHPVPYDPDGPPGQTRDTNAAPLTRTHHRAKTHAGWTVRQHGLDRHYWRTPHGLYRETGPAGTRVIDETTYHRAVKRIALDRALDAIEKSLRP